MGIFSAKPFRLVAVAFFPKQSLLRSSPHISWLDHDNPDYLLAPIYCPRRLSLSIPKDT